MRVCQAASVWPAKMIVSMEPNSFSTGRSEIERRALSFAEYLLYVRHFQ